MVYISKVKIHRKYFNKIISVIKISLFTYSKLAHKSFAADAVEKFEIAKILEYTTNSVPIMQSSSKLYHYLSSSSIIIIIM